MEVDIRGGYLPVMFVNIKTMAEYETCHNYRCENRWHLVDFYKAFLFPFAKLKKKFN